MKLTVISNSVQNRRRANINDNIECFIGSAEGITDKTC
jgi:hypothetical protein